jgi:hypothetical protein
MNKLLLFALVALSLFALAAGQEEEENVNLEVEEDAEVMELAEPEPRQKHKRKNCDAKCKNPNSKKCKRCRKNQSRHSKKKPSNKKPKGKKRNPKPTKPDRGPHSRNTCRSSTTCVENAYKYMSAINKKISFWKKQKARADTHGSKATKKQDKKGDFDTGLNNLITAGGGSKGSPACNGNTTSAGAMTLKALIANMTACSANIHSACGNETAPAAPTDAEVTACETIMDDFKAMAEACGKLSNDAACTCWDNATFASQLELINNCTNNKMSNGMTMKDYQKAVTAAKKNCTDAFGQCRKDEDAAGAAISTCNQSGDKLTEKLNTVAATSAAAAAVKAKITALTGSRIMKSKRAVPTTCADFLSGVQALFALMADNLFGDYTSTSNDLAAFSGSCSDDEKTALAAESAKADAIVADATAITAQIQSQIEELTGSTASSDQISAATTPAASGGATESGRKRRLAIEKLLRRANFK